MNISSSIRPSITKANAPTTQAAPKKEASTVEDQYAAQDRAYEAYAELRSENETKSKLAYIGTTIAGVAAGAVAGHFLGNTTGLAGRIIGSVVGGAAGVTVGALGGSVLAEMNDAGSGALAYLGLGGVAGGVAGLAAGAIAGGDATPIIGAVAGGLGGLSLGYMGGAMLSDSIDDGLRKQAGLSF